MRAISDAWPCPARDSMLVQKVSSQLSGCFDYLLDRAEAVLHCDTSQFRGLLGCSQIDGGKVQRLRGTICALYTSLENAMVSGDVESVQVLVESDLAEVLPYDALRISSLGAGMLSTVEERYLKALLEYEYERTYKATLTLSSPSVQSSKQSIEAVEKALTVLREIDVNLYLEMQQLITDIVIVDADGLNAGSSFTAFGVILLRSLQPDQTWTAYFEHLTHEAAHHHLFALCLTDPLFNEDPSALFRSPLRKEGRPISAIYHAMFVLSRIAYATSLLHQMDAYSRCTRTAIYNFPNTAPLRDQFQAAYETIKRNASLTPVGIALLESCRDLTLAA